ncbi:hypothetical protein DLH72_03025, partial [Candidatus Gracilibacteria bacterium]
MKRILIRIESHSKSGIGGMESRILEFSKILENNYVFLTNSKILIESKYFGEKKYIFSNYFSFLGILKDIFSFRNFDIIDSNGLRDNIISSLNFFQHLSEKFFSYDPARDGVWKASPENRIIPQIMRPTGLLDPEIEL